MEIGYSSPRRGLRPLHSVLYFGASLEGDPISNEICYASATELALRIRNKTLSPLEVVRAHLDRIQAVNSKLNAVVTLADGAMDSARKAEAALMRNETLGPLHGVPFTAKDCFDTAGIQTARGSRIFANRVPRADATAVSRLKQAGAILLGKTNLPEFSLWSETSNVMFGQTNNPWKLDRTPGGSSGGEGAAVSAGLSPLGMGTDLGGSNRLPAHYCNLVGFKPTHGRIPLTGTWPDLMARFMHVGTLTRTVQDAALSLSVLTGPNGKDPYAVPVPAPGVPDLGKPLQKLTVGWCAEGPFAPVDSEIQKIVVAAAAALESRGCQMKPISLAEWEQRKPIEVGMNLLGGEIATYLEPFVSGHHEKLAPSSRRLLGSPMPTFAEYLKALADVERLREDMTQYFSDLDLLLLPTAPLTAHVHGAATFQINGKTVPASHAGSATVGFGLTGSPAISIPFGFSQDRLPIGVQLVARHFEESVLFQAALALEAHSGVFQQHPPI